tara:strand:- start:66 stop:359 length:294 start_codon:yes stop_codon:yes gene_type:complete
MTEQDLHDYNKWLTEVWSKQHSNIPFMKDAPNGYLKYRTKQLTIPDVVDSKRFTEADLLNGYQAGCIEGLDDCCDLGLDDLKEIKEDGKKWVKRYTE